MRRRCVLVIKGPSNVYGAPKIDVYMSYAMKHFVVARKVYLNEICIGMESLSLSHTHTLTHTHTPTHTIIL